MNPSSHASARASCRVASYFIGGAGDKSRFLLFFRQTNLLKSLLINHYTAHLASSGQDKLEVNHTPDKLYWGFDEMDALLAEIKSTVRRFRAVKIRLIGHSFGGFQAAKLSTRLAQEGIVTDLLITLDPVGSGNLSKFVGLGRRPVHPKANTWVNICANHTIRYDRTDAVADLGVRWKPGRDRSLKIQPHSDFGVPHSHTAIWEMMHFPGIAGDSAWGLLTQRVE